MRRAVRIAEVLKVEKVGVNDNFFELGGHSLLAVKIISQMQLQVDMELSLSSILRARTIENIARLIDDASLLMYSSEDVSLISDQLDEMSADELKKLFTEG